MLEKTEIMLNTIICEINYLLTPVEEIVLLLSLREELDDLFFIRECRKRIESGQDFRSAWNDSLTDFRNKRYLVSDDCVLLKEFGEKFGATDRQGQVSVCLMYLELFRDKIRLARTKREKYSDLFNGMGLLCGIGIVILLV